MPTEVSEVHLAGQAQAVQPWSDVELLRYACEQATLSPDPSTQNGAFLAREGLPVPGTEAWNCLGRGIAVTAERQERPLKYLFYEHAERNAIYAAARQGIACQGLTLVCPWAACADCARAIIQAGIVELLTLKPRDDETNQRWFESCAAGFQMMEEAGVRVTFYEGTVGGPELRRNGQPLIP